MAHKIAGVTGGRDENGIVTLTQPWWCETLAQCFSVGDDQITISGTKLYEESRAFGVWDSDTTTNGYQIGITYRGPDFSLDRSITERFGFQSEFSEQPIEMHPAISILEEKHGGRITDLGGEKRLVFLEFIDEGGEGSGGFSKGQEAFLEKNPNFGVKTFPQFETVWTHTYIEKTLPKGLLFRVSSAIDDPPGNPPTPKGRNWLIMAPEIEIFPRKSGYRITDFYKLSPPGGWKPALTKLSVK